MFKIFNDMSDKEKKQKEQEVSEENQQEKTPENTGKEKKRHKEDSKKSEIENYEETINELGTKLADTNDKYLRLYSEFDNYRKRTSKERIDLSKTASEDLIVSFLPILDDFERALKAIDLNEQNTALREGIELVYKKMQNIFMQKGLKAMESIGNVFDPDLHEAIAQTPAQDEDSKGKILDEVEKGYYLFDKVIRYAKVVVAN